MQWKRRRRRRKQKLIPSRCFPLFSGGATLDSAEAAVSCWGRAVLRSGAGSYQGRSHFSDLGVKLPGAELGECETSVSAKPLVSLTPWEWLPWLLTRVGGWWGWHSTHLLQWINLPPVSRPRLQSGFNSTIIELTECVIIRCFTETRMFGCEAPQCRLIQSTTNGKNREALFSALNFQIVLSTHYMHKPDPETCSICRFYDPWMVKCLLKFLSSLKCMGSSMHAVWERGCSYFILLNILKDSAYVPCFHETMQRFPYKRSVTWK